MSSCNHHRTEVTKSIGINAHAFLRCTVCGQTHILTKDEDAIHKEYMSLEDGHSDGEYLASLLKEEDRCEEDPNIVHF